eukprot:CAMPEP_0202691586 /NCGR_PEP_ID=MMETSP1385-20130828/6258_1 /ASSEMBLY_ACC=CAM_ASM_000861 /TAXON_ID=933848 /ORGANISM="Elphidium margaritaceum" /LENGTH=402 /DNA_ID=CAMNT_0049347015 /DNA_START=24 /DNA_END=1232 /DNA_ORIENTATION=-
MSSATAVVFSLFVLIEISCGAIWEYDEPGKNISHWPSLFEECGYQQQSPIDIPTFAIEAECEESLSLEWLANGSEHVVIRNVGKSLIVIPFDIETEGSGDLSGLEVLHHANDTSIRLKNAFYHTYESAVHEEYCFDSLHFHWGRHNDEGSEHTVGGTAYPLEAHFVHYSCDWEVASMSLQDYAAGNLDELYDDDHVLAVIGVLFEIGEANPVIEQILNDVILGGIKEYHDPSLEFGDHLLELYYDDIDLSGLMPSSKTFYGYQGSLTTPPCYETVRWHVLTETMTVSEQQMESFRSLLESTALNDSMAPNYRPVQDLNNRTIYRCAEDVEVEMVEKEAEPASAGQEGDSTTEDAWFVLAIVFIVLFGLSAILNMGLLFRVCREPQSGKYSPAPTSELPATSR